MDAVKLVISEEEAVKELTLARREKLKMLN